MTTQQAYKIFEEAVSLWRRGKNWEEYVRVNIDDGWNIILDHGYLSLFDGESNEVAFATREEQMTTLEFKTK